MATSGDCWLQEADEESVSESGYAATFSWWHASESADAALEEQFDIDAQREPHAGTISIARIVTIAMAEVRKCGSARMKYI
jgi:hypothetical protein